MSPLPDPADRIAALARAQQPDVRPRDMAIMVIWRPGIPNPISMDVEESEAMKALAAYADGAERIEFTTYNKGEGRRSRSVFSTASLVGITVEYATIPFASALDH